MAPPPSSLPPPARSSRATSLPLESVVIPSPSKPHKAQPAEQQKNNIKVCIRIRPLLPSDSLAPAAADSPPKRVTRSTVALRTHTSGLVTPVRSAAVSKVPVNSGASQQEPAWLCPTPQTIIQNPHTKEYTSRSDAGKSEICYTFDRVYGPASTNEELYRESVADVVKNCVAGFHGSVFAYGQTNSGKTHTMTGSRRNKDDGVIRLAVEDIFRQIQNINTNSPEQQHQQQREYLLRVSYLEIYNEQIYDLLAPQNNCNPRFGMNSNNLQHHHLPPSTAVRIFESRTEGVQVRGLREEIVTCPQDVYELLDVGDARRKVGSTGMNTSSSRSHSVFRLVLESRASSSGGSIHKGSNNGMPPSLAPSSNSSVASDADSIASGRSSITQSLGTAIKGPVRISSLSLVDLAGSESVKATGSTGVRQKEGQYINKSLLTLGHVVHKLSEISARAEKESNSVLLPPKEHIPYRDSKLTRLLQPSLGGNAKVCIICNISPASANVEESHNTLKFGSRAKTIQQHASITEVADEKTLLRSYREEIEELKRQLNEARKAAVEVSGHTPAIKEHKEQLTGGAPSSDEEDQDDTHVLVSAIRNLESLILKAGAKSSKKTIIEKDSFSVDGMEAEDTFPSRRSLDADLKRAENADSGSSDSVDITDGAKNYSNASPEEDDQGDLLEELHRIQGMLGKVMKKRKDKPSSSTANGKKPTPDRDEEVEKLRIQLQEQEITSTMRKADSSFLQSQLYEKENLLKEVSVFLVALEKRQRALEQENAQLKEDLALANTLIKEGDKAREELTEKLAKAQQH
eukprot:CCRYP_018226-RA/>CCRYP_018226-RA protein AED:0.27 eAED:0.27 QI:82/1/1/1/1/1/3/477/800